MTSFTFAALQPDYTRRLQAMKETKKATAGAVAKRLLVDRGRFTNVAEATGVPAIWIMATFEREGPDFSCYLGNGDPLDKITTDVPAGRGPFATWEAGCSDALRLDDVTQAGPWSWEMMCFEWERYNGFGPREHGRTSGYLWAGTDQYAGGKYISDGVWSPRTWDAQLGCIIVAKEIAALDPALAEGLKSYDDLPHSG